MSGQPVFVFVETDWRFGYCEVSSQCLGVIDRNWADLWSV